MSTRMSTLKKTLARLAVGGTTFAWLSLGSWGGWGGASWGACVSNSALTNFYTDVGHASIDTLAASAGGLGADVDNIVITPTAGFFRDLWSTWVDLRIPTDPTFDRLLAE